MAKRAAMVKAMDALLQAGAKISNVAQWCRDHDVQPRTFYRHKTRVATEGAWRERSRRPHHWPAATPAELEAWIVKLRADLGVDNGADYIRDELKRIKAEAGAAWAVPSRSTINRVLSRHDLLERNPAKRPRSSWRRFSFARPRDCYQIDATEYTLASGVTVVIFDVLDDCTRLLAACHAAAAETADAAIAAIGAAVAHCGAPALVLADNDVAFTNRFLHPTAGPSRFFQTLAKLGTRLIHSSPYHPQTCGKVERHHQTLKKWLRAQAQQPNTIAELQALLDTYRAHYNARRHSALAGRATPQQAWDNAPSHGGPSALPVQTDATVHKLNVSATGTITVAGRRIGIGTAHRGQPMTVIRDNDRATVYTSEGEPIGHADLSTDKSYIPLTRITT